MGYRQYGRVWNKYENLIKINSIHSDIRNTCIHALQNPKVTAPFIHSCYLCSCVTLINRISTEAVKSLLLCICICNTHALVSMFIFASVYVAIENICVGYALWIWCHMLCLPWKPPWKSLSTSCSDITIPKTEACSPVESYCFVVWSLLYGRSL